MTEVKKQIEEKQEGIIIETESEVKMYNSYVKSFGVWLFVSGMCMTTFLDSLRQNNIVFSLILGILFLYTVFMAVEVYTNHLEEH